MIPSRAGISAEDCRRYALSLPVASLVCGIQSMDNLKQDIAVARNFSPMDESEKSELLAKVKDVAGDGRFGRFKSSKAFDGSYHRAQHGF